MKVWTKGKKSAEVATYAEASRAVRAAWAGDRRGGPGFYGDKTAGLIESTDGTVVAHVSYNGRVWLGANRLGGVRTEVTL